ncbi:RNase P subunit p30 [Thozetella sp. PMI_491]|nr:RNase P subunit p30 [Thozetella sp. PMI_491]
MLYDLNLLWTPSASTDELHKTLRFAKSLGYDVVALNHIVSLPIPKVVTNEIPQIPPPPPPAQPPSQGATVPAASTPPSAFPTILRRVTVTVTDPGVTNHKLPDFARAYDMLAVRPATAQAFQWACISADEASLITLDMTVPLGYHIAPRTAMAAVQRGARFEICYGQAVQSRGEAHQRARSNFIANVLSLLRATKGRGIVVSSEARSALGLRGPADVVNLLAVWGLGPEKGTEALRGMPRSVVVNEGIKRRGFRGVIDIVETAGPDPNPPEKRDKDGKEGGQKSAGQGLQGHKRKKGDGAEGGQAALSKRQAKKLRLAAEQADGGKTQEKGKN